MKTIRMQDASQDSSAASEEEDHQIGIMFFLNFSAHEFSGARLLCEGLRGVYVW